MTAIADRILDRELKKGSAELVILALLEARPRHGYEISQVIEQRSEGAVRFKVASLYPLLYRLERRGWIAGHWVEKEGQRRRRYYRLTREGRACSPSSARDGGASSPPSTASRRPAMRDLRGGALGATAGSNASSTRRCIRRSSRSSAQHLDERYRSLLARGLTAADAERSVLEELETTMRSSASCARAERHCRRAPPRRLGEPRRSPASSAAGFRTCAMRRARSAQESRLHRRCGPHARARRRRQHRDLLRRQRRDAAAAAVRRARSAGAHLREQPGARLAPVLCLRSELPRLARAGDELGGAGRERRRHSVASTGDAASKSFAALRVTAEFLPALGFSPALGRDFRPEEDRAWRRRRTS